MRYFYFLMCVKRAQDPSPPSWLIDDSWIFHKKNRDNRKLRICRAKLSEEGEAKRVKKIQIGKFL